MDGGGVDKEPCIKYSRFMGRIVDVIENVQIDPAVSIPVIKYSDILPCFLIIPIITSCTLIRKIRSVDQGLDGECTRGEIEYFCSIQGEHHISDHIIIDTLINGEHEVVDGDCLCASYGEINGAENNFRVFHYGSFIRFSGGEFHRRI